MKKYLQLVLLLAAAATGLSQSETQPYFALSSNQTFSTHSKPSVSISSWAVTRSNSASTASKTR